MILKYRSTSYTILISSLLLSSTAYSGDLDIKGRGEINARIGHERSIGMTEFWVPFAQSDKAVLYGDYRLMGDNQDNREFNLGVGYREIIEAKALGRGIVGAHGWLDRRITARGSKFNQVTVGGEWLGEDFDILVNGYVPLSDSKNIEVANANPQGAALTGTGIFIDTNGVILEEPQHGVDVEFGVELGRYSPFLYRHTDSFRVYGGAYYFDGPNTENVAGWRTRFTADVTENVQFGARFQRDDVRGSQGFLEATLRFPFGHKKSYREEGLRARLDESPERDIDIVTNEVVTDTGDQVQVLNATTGAVQEVLHVDNTAAGGGDGSAENPFNILSDAEAAASAHTIIYVNEGTGDATNQDQGITLSQTGQQLIGSGTNFIYDAGTFTTANGANPTATLIAAATTAPVIGNVNAGQDGVTISADNITIAGLTVDNANAGRDGVKVIADGGGASTQNIAIQNVTAQNARHGIYIHGTNGGSVSTMVQNAVTTSNSQHGIAVYDDTNSSFTADLGGGEMGSAGNNVLAGNALEDLAVDYDGRALSAQNNWWGQASGPDTDTPDVGIAPQIYYGAPINDGLGLHLTFDTEWTTNTTAYDRSGNANNGTYEGSLSLLDSVAGEKREAFNLDAPDYVVVADDPTIDMRGTDNRTYSVWVNADNIPGAGCIVCKGFGQELAYSLELVGNRLRTQTWQGGGTRIDTTDNTTLISSGSWNHLAITSNDNGDGTKLESLYIDGSLVFSATPTINYFNGSEVTIGANVRNDLSVDRQYDGNIDDTRIYSRPLDASEISELYRMNTSSSVDTSGYLTGAP